MKLNPDCIRDILFFTQDFTDYNTSLFIHSDNYTKFCDKYSFDELIYHIDQCKNYGLIFADPRGSMYSIKDLTPQGHTFLENITKENNWEATKSKAFKIGSYAIPILQQIASAIIIDKLK